MNPKQNGPDNVKYIHGETKTRLHRIWSRIKARCGNPNVKDYKYYGGRGIKICEEWRNDYMVFRQWALSNGYNETLTIDRKETNGDYEPNNCRWSNVYDQMNNTRRNRKLNIGGSVYSISQASRIFGIRPQTIAKRLNLGWSDIKAVTEKPMIGKNQYA